MYELLPFYSLDNSELQNLLLNNNYSYNDKVQLDSIYTPLQNYIENNFIGLQSYSRIFKNMNIQEFNDETLSKRHLLSCRISLIHLNIRSLNANIDEFQVFVNSFKTPVDVFILSEIWTTNIHFLVIL